ncbi:hypothetical protein GQ55_1G320000 [Panicum hallii var. hallii]|uniref:Myb-like domain-containing protein n=1 Tax=Panicum hallii var. hallii TaxID=1504633 RepID=A0A2T7F9Q0_9POAL|nr:hypothetical protein GQ55_1G320000 [Panicum hallii var. hallii]
MLHHHGGAGFPYMAPTTAGADPFSPTPTGPASVAAIIPPLPMELQSAAAGTARGNFEELPAGGSSAAAAASLQDDDVPADVGAGGAGASGSGGGHRWPREETLALIRIRTEMDADFRNAPLKAPLWEDVARKLAGLGYHRSAKKCKEKFENVDKYYRRTKDARAGRQDGRSYRFFAQLEALHAAAQQQRQATGMAAAVRGDHQPSGTMAWTAAPATVGGPPAGAGLPDLSFSSMSGSESESESDDDLDVAEAGPGNGEGGGDDREIMAIFEGMMRQVTEKQDAMQRVFLETLERWEAERTAREEAWRRQEVARMNREREQLARERAVAASRDAALIAFLQRVGGGQQGEPTRLPPPIAVALPMPNRTPPSPRHDAAAQPTSLQPVPAPPKLEEARAWAGGEGSGGSMPSRWPKEEVQVLIQLRTEKNEQYHDAGAKGPLWEDIAAGMRRIGYNRSAKRCKEKWENINKYYKKVKESNKRRPEDSKTCPYFHHLDAMYRKKRFAAGGSSTAPGAYTAAGAGAGAVTSQENPNQRELEGKSSNDADGLRNDGQGNVHAPPRPGNGETAPATTENKRAEDAVKGTNQLLQQFGADETESDDNDMGGDYTEESNDEDKMKYKTAFQNPNVIGSSGNDAPAPPATAAAPTSSTAPTSSSFLAVQ